MANAVLFVGWGTPIAGREQKALQVFGETLQYYQRLQSQGEIESFEPFQLEPHGGDLSGFLLIRGDREQLARVRSNPEFLHNVNRATLVVQNIGVVTAFTGEDLNRLFADYQAQIAEFA